MSGRAQSLLVGAVVLAAVVLVWQYVSGSEERAIANRLEEFAAEFNQSATDGLGALARAARLGQYFTPDVVVELGQGSPPIHGRETLIGMAARLQPRTAAFVFELDDVTVQLLGEDRAEATLTAVIRRRRSASGDESIDAREFSTELRRVDGDWRVSRVVAIDTLR